MTEAHLDRRRLLGGAALAGVALPLVAACSSGDGATAPAGGAGATGGAPSETPPPSGPVTLVAVADVPVGGGVILPDQRVVVTQPTDGEIRAFGIACTHSGCAVNRIADGKIFCPCHGSIFSVTDGSVVRGPAPAPLVSVDVTVEGGEVVTS